MNIRAKSLNAINIEAISALNNAIGIANTIRFLNQFIVGYGDYALEKEKIFENMELNDIVREIKEMRNKSKI